MTIIRKRFTHTLLPALLAAFAGFAACSSDDDAPEPPKPSGYDIYTAGYTTPASKAVATVWKNGQLLYTLTDGTNDAWAYAVCVSDGTVYAAGYERQGDRIVAKVWENGTLKYTPGAPGADSYAYSVFAANGSLYTAGSEESGGALTAKIWKDGDALYAYSVSPAVSQARSVCVSGGDVYAAGSLQSGLTKPLAVVWKNDKAHYTLSDGETPAGVNALCLSGRTLYAAGHSGGAAAVWKDKELLYTLTDGSSYAEATAVCRFGHTLYTAGYHTDGFEEEGVVWKEGQELFDLSDGPGSGSMPYRSPSATTTYSPPERFSARRGPPSYGTATKSDTRSPTARVTAKPTRCTSSRSTTDASRKRKKGGAPEWPRPLFSHAAALRHADRPSPGDPNDPRVVITLAARRAVDTDRAVHLRLVNALFAVFLPDHVEVELHLRGGPVAPVDHERLPFQTIRRIEFSESEVVALDPVVLIHPFEPQRQRPRHRGPRRRGRNGVRRHFVAFSAVCHGDGPAENRIRLIGIEQIHARRGVGNEKADRRIHEIIDRHLVFHLLRTAGKHTQRQRNAQQKNFKFTHKLAI